MLGVNSPREPITPEFSKEIRESLRRAITGQPNEKEKAAQKRMKESEKSDMAKSLAARLCRLPRKNFLLLRNL